MYAPQVISFQGTRDAKAFTVNLDTKLHRRSQVSQPASTMPWRGQDVIPTTFPSMPPIHSGYAASARCARWPPPAACLRQCQCKGAVYYVSASGGALGAGGASLPDHPPCYPTYLLRLCLKALRPHLRPGMPLLLTGHSMGGALAVVMAVGLSDEGWDVRRVVTWGSPKVGKDELRASASGLNILRVSHADDLVVYLPPMHLMGYHHLGAGLILANFSLPYYAFLPPGQRPSTLEALRKVFSVGLDRQLFHRAASHRMNRCRQPPLRAIDLGGTCGSRWPQLPTSVDGDSPSTRLGHPPPILIHSSN